MYGYIYNAKRALSDFISKFVIRSNILDLFQTFEILPARNIRHSSLDPINSSHRLVLLHYWTRNTRSTLYWHTFSKLAKSTWPAKWASFFIKTGASIFISLHFFMSHSSLRFIQCLKTIFEAFEYIHRYNCSQEHRDLGNRIPPNKGTFKNKICTLCWAFIIIYKITRAYLTWFCELWLIKYH